MLRVLVVGQVIVRLRRAPLSPGACASRLGQADEPPMRTPRQGVPPSVTSPPNAKWQRRRGSCSLALAGPLRSTDSTERRTPGARRRVGGRSRRGLASRSRRGRLGHRVGRRRWERRRPRAAARSGAASARPKAVRAAHAAAWFTPRHGGASTVVAWRTASRMDGRGQRPSGSRVIPKGPSCPSRGPTTARPRRPLGERGDHSSPAKSTAAASAPRRSARAARGGAARRTLGENAGRRSRARGRELAVSPRGASA
jgi:hypothetical protein